MTVFRLAGRLVSRMCGSVAACSLCVRSAGRNARGPSDQAALTSATTFMLAPVLSRADG